MIGIRAQYSMEFILVFAFSLVIIIPLISIMHGEYGKSKESLDESQARQVLDQIAMTAQTTHYQGYPTRSTIDVFFPKGVTRINSYSNFTASGALKSELVFVVKKGNAESDLVSVFPFNVSASLKIIDGKRKILIKSEKGANDLEYVNITDYE